MNVVTANLLCSQLNKSVRMFLTTLALLSFVAAANAVPSLHYTDCSASPDKIAHVENGHLSMDPIHIPGPETVDIDLQILRPIEGNHFTAHVVLQKKILFGFVNLPCISEVGSCSYDLCTVLSGHHYNNTHHCPVEIADSSPDFPCACPFPTGNYHLNPTKFNIPVLSGVWTFLATGDYKLHVTVTDNNKNNEEVFCYDIAVKLEANCSGISCIFG